jgi:hypothetical protein
MNVLALIIATGTGATLMMDLASVARRWLFDTPLPNYALVGRWIAHSVHGQFRHRAISAAAPVRGERTLGWLVHYLTGIAFACLLSAACGTEWFERPTAGPALLTGVITVLAPFLIMQPAMGSGFAASRAPRPGAARLHSLLNHATFGLGLYLSARLINL